jgi:hypothetical protein
MPDDKTLVKAYEEMVTDRITRGFKPTILTFMFKPITASPEGRAMLMQAEIEGVYHQHAKRCFHRLDKLPINEMPFWIGCPDWPVYKTERDSLPIISINDGLHFHFMALTPDRVRWDGRLEDHFDEQQASYLRPLAHLDRIHSRTVVDRPEYVTDYVLKSLKNHRGSMDNVIVLPKKHSEMTSYKRLAQSPKIEVERRRIELQEELIRDALAKTSFTLGNWTVKTKIRK